MQNLREVKIIRQYHIQKPEDYRKYAQFSHSWLAHCLARRYNKMVGEIRSITTKLQKLDSKDPFRIKSTQQLLEKL